MRQSHSPFSSLWMTPLSLRRAGAAGIGLTGDTAYFAPNCLAANVSSVLGDNDHNTAVTAGVNASSTFTIAKLGTYELCYRSNGQTDAVPQILVSLSVHAKTPANVVALASLTAIPTRESFKVTLIGTTKQGDKAKWATSCAGTAGVWSQTGWTAVAAGKNQATTFPAIKTKTAANAAPATYRLCYQAKDSVDGVQQGVIAAVGSDSSPSQISKISPLSISADTPTSVTVTGTIAFNDTFAWTTGSCAAAALRTGVLALGTNQANTVNFTAGNYRRVPDKCC